MCKLLHAVCIDVPVVILEYDTRSGAHDATRGGPETPTVVCIGSPELRELNDCYCAIRARNPHYLIRGHRQRLMFLCLWNLKSVSAKGQWIAWDNFPS